MQLALKFYPESFDLTEPPANHGINEKELDYYMAQYSFEDPTKIKTCFKVRIKSWSPRFSSIVSYHVPQIFQEIAVIQL